MSKIIVILGPTGIGKTKMSIELAKQFNGEIINADSMQIYKELNIGTAKIKDSEKQGVPHHLIDIKTIDDDYSVYNYQMDAREIINKILANNKTPIIVGGTGLYIKALLYNYEFNKEERFNNYDELSNEELLKRVISFDEEIDIHVNNRKRLIRKLNYYENNANRSCSNCGDKLLYDVLFIGLTTNRDVLYRRINERVETMINDGLVDEAKIIYSRAVNSRALSTAIGYKELFKYFDGTLTLEESIDLIKKNSRHYAKRQYTWFNNQMTVNWFDVNFENFSNTVANVVRYIKDNSDL